MKIERINDKQIRCTLTTEDLESREIKLSELAYGSEKTRALFRDMMEQAAEEFGFEAEDIPLMIEAIPMTEGRIVLLITKVDNPEELDTRFSSFSEMPEEEEDSDSYETSTLTDEPDAAENLFNLVSDLMTKQEQPPAETHKELSRHFIFREIEDAIRAAKELHCHAYGGSTLYKDTKGNVYHMIVRQENLSTRDFQKTINLLSAYLPMQKCAPGTEAYLAEHYKLLLPELAIESLAIL